jgi:hypothetical protein
MVTQVEQNYSLADYLYSAEKLVVEYQYQEQTREQYQTLKRVLDQARLLNDAIRIHNGWQREMSVQLAQQYSDEELLELHGTDSCLSRLIRHGEYYEIRKDNEIIRFILCGHATYTPIYPRLTLSHQCLQC